MDSIKKCVLRDAVNITLGFCIIILLIMKAHIVISLDGDNCPQTYALFGTMARSVHNGVFSAWNPYLWGGFPNVGHFITESSYPINRLLCFLFLNRQTMVVSYAIIPCNLIIHLCLYYAGMYFLLMKMGFSSLNAFSVGIVSALCGSLLSFMYWLVYFDGFCWLPFLLLASVKMFEAEDEKKLLYSIELGVLFGVEALISVSLMLVISVFLFGILFISYLFGSDRIRIFSNIKYSILSGTLGMLFAAPVLLSALTFIPNMVRYVPDMGYLEWGTQIPVEEYFKYVYDFPQLLKMITFKNDVSLMISLSPFVLLFSVLGIFGGRKENKRLHYISFLGMVVCILACFGIIIPAVFYYIPGLNQIREAVMYGILLGMFAGVVAAQGFHYIEQAVNGKGSAEIRKERLVLCAASVLGLLGYNVLAGSIIGIIFTCFVILNIVLSCLKSDRIRKSFFAMATLVCVAVCIADMYSAMDTYHYTEKEAIERVERTCENSGRLVSYVNSLDLEDGYYRMTSWGYLPSYPENIASVVGFYDVKGYLNPLFASGLDIHTIMPLEKRAQLQNIKYYLVNSGDDQSILDYFSQDIHYTRVGEIDGIYLDWAGKEQGTIYVYQALDNLGDAWIVSEYIWNDTCSRKEVLQMISEEDFKVDSIAIIEKCRLREREKENLAGLNPQAEKGDFIRGNISSQGMEYFVNTGTSGILVTSELYYPGWEVYVNGEKSTVLVVDGTNRGVVVPAGESTVEFFYRPWELRVGRILQAVGAGLCFVLLNRALRKKVRGDKGWNIKQKG